MTPPGHLVRSFIMSILLGVILYAVTVVGTDLHAVLMAAVQLGFSGWLTILSLSLINYGLRFFRWQRYLARLGDHVPIAQNMVYYLAGFAFTATPGKAGEAIRSVYLQRHRVPYSHSLSAFFAERFVDIIAMLLLALTTAFAFERARWPLGFLGAIIIATLPLIHGRLLRRFIEKIGGCVTSARFKAVLDHLQDLLVSSSMLLRAGPLYGGAFVGLVAWGAESCGFYIILVHLGAHVSVMLAIGIYAVSILIGAISFVPGGLGTTEATMFFLLSSLGVDAPTVVAATLICRIATLWFAVAIGLIAMGGLTFSGSGILSTKE